MKQPKKKPPFFLKGYPKAGNPSEWAFLGMLPYAQQRGRRRREMRKGRTR
jgi:hypothetical protein